MKPPFLSSCCLPRCQIPVDKVIYSCLINAGLESKQLKRIPASRLEREALGPALRRRSTVLSCWNMEVSWNRKTSNSSIFIGFVKKTTSSSKNGYPHFWKPPYGTWQRLAKNGVDERETGWWSDPWHSWESPFFGQCNRSNIRLRRILWYYMFMCTYMYIHNVYVCILHICIYIYTYV